MNATEARALSDAAAKGPVSKPFISALNSAIEHKATKGETSIDPWAYLATLRMPGPTPNARHAIEAHFRAQGFKWTDHPDPDPGNPTSHAYATLSWG